MTVASCARGTSGGTRDEPARHAVELDQGERGGELLARGDQDRAALQLGMIDVEAGAVR